MTNSYAVGYEGGAATSYGYYEKDDLQSVYEEAVANFLNLVSSSGSGN